MVNFHSTKIRSWQSNHVTFEAELSAVNYIGITSFESTPPSSESTSLCMRDDVTIVDECKQSTTTLSTHVKKNFQMNTFHAGLKSWMDLYRHCFFPGSYLKYALSLSKVKYDNRIKNPQGDRDLYNLHNYLWVVILQRTAFQWWCHGNRGLLLAEKGIPKLCMAPSW